MLRILQLLFAVLLLHLLAGLSQAHDPAEEMATAAERFITSLDDKAKKQALFEFNADARQHWRFVPAERYGLKIADMTEQQRLLAHALLNSGLTHKGYRQALSIMTLEAILHDLENKNPIRDPAKYYVAIFGTPGEKATWGWRFEGHHLSINFTIVDGKLFSVTPSFFGTNPAIVQAGPHKGLEILQAEQQLARELVQSLSPEQRKKAVIATEAPRDIITGQERKVNRGQFSPAEGIPFAELNEQQQEMLLKLVNEYAAKYRPEIVAQIDEREPFTNGKEMVFAWAGGTEPGDGHYYRVQTPAFLFEYDNTQNNANHVHAVWRHFDGDFGEDLLRKHYDEAKHHQ